MSEEAMTIVYTYFLQYVISFILNGECIPNARGNTCSTKGTSLEAIGTASNTMDPADWISVFISLLMKGDRKATVGHLC